ncbi:hypothetical protein F3Y22_tig00004779pilonHSYRG00187 [Hibiscus syriacus]|uniref:Uncharacterized protein n=1 Tax=Hibiscus syriacus TaxID=106335 RepID=A0A6A3CI41_HIBSY|nr:hypothetical protein F3Y22_tig00004779pilonHSYRG00187 [Hibiscus syriacus]
MASLNSLTFLAIFLAMHLNIAKTDFLSSLLQPIFDDVCKEVGCGKGKCKPSSNGTLPYYICECDAGWKQTAADQDDDYPKLCTKHRSICDFNVPNLKKELLIEFEFCGLEGAIGMDCANLGISMSNRSTSETPASSGNDANRVPVLLSQKLPPPQKRVEKPIVEPWRPKPVPSPFRPPELHAAISVAGVAAAVAAIAAEMVASSGNDKPMAKMDMVVASAATLVAAQCVEAAEAMGAEREHLASVISFVVNVRTAEDIITLNAGAATSLRGAAILKARALAEVWNIAVVIPMDKGGSNGSSNGGFNGELLPEESFLGFCSRELLAKGCELLKRSITGHFIHAFRVIGDLHWKIVSVYTNRMNQVILKTKSRHIAGSLGPLQKRKRTEALLTRMVYAAQMWSYICRRLLTSSNRCDHWKLLKICRGWPGRHLLEGGENRRYFALKTVMCGVVEFERKNQREHDV